VFARLVFIELALAEEESNESANRRVNIVIRGFMREIAALCFWLEKHANFKIITFYFAKMAKQSETKQKYKI